MCTLQFLLCGVFARVLWFVCLWVSRVQFPTIPGPGLLLASVVGPHHSWLRAFAAAPRQPWLGFAAGGGWSPTTLGLGVWVIAPRHCWPWSTAGGCGLYAVCVRCVWRACSCVLVRGAFFVVLPVAPSVFVFARCWSVPRVCGFVCVYCCFALLVVPPLRGGPGVCRLCLTVCWSGCCVGFVCDRCAVSLCVCSCVLSVFACGVRCVGSVVWASGYAIPGLVRVVGQHGHHKRFKKRSCKCAACWGGGRCGFYACP